MTRRDLERRLGRRALPAPPAALRERVLSAAAAAARPHGPAGLAQRLWFSRGWRFAWVAAVALLLLTQAAVVDRVAGRFETPAPVAPDPIAGLAQELGLERGWHATVRPARDVPSFEEIWNEAR